MLGEVEHKKGIITSGPGFRSPLSPLFSFMTVFATKCDVSLMDQRTTSLTEHKVKIIYTPHPPPPTSANCVCGGVYCFHAVRPPSVRPFVTFLVSGSYHAK